MPDSKSVCLLKLYPNQAEIGYFGAKTCKLIHLSDLAQNPGYGTVCPVISCELVIGTGARLLHSFVDSYLVASWQAQVSTKFRALSA